MHWLASHQGLEGLVASSAKFQTLTGTANATAAKARVYFGGAPSNAVRPLAYITVEGGNVEHVTHGSQSGSLVLSIEVPASTYTDSTSEEDLSDFMSDIDTILSQMEANSEARTVNWNMVGLSSVVPPHLVAEQQDDPDAPYYAASFLIRWT